jgi:hypothetical protein
MLQVVEQRSMLAGRAPVKQKTTFSDVADAVFKCNIKGNLTIANSLFVDYARRSEVPPGYAFHETAPETLFELILSNEDTRYFDGINNFLSTRIARGVCDLHARAIGEALVRYAAKSRPKFTMVRPQTQILARLAVLAKFDNPADWCSVFTHNRADNSLAALLIGKQIVQQEMLQIVRNLVRDKVAVDSVGVLLQDRYRCTWLHCAAAVNQFALVEALLEAGANPRITLGELNPGAIDNPDVAALDAMKIALAQKAIESAQMIGAVQAKSGVDSILAKFGLGRFAQKTGDEDE